MGTDSLLLTADLGNSRLKLRAWSAALDRPRASRDVDGAESWAAAVRDFGRELPHFRAAAVSSVAAPEREREVLAALSDAVRGPVLVSPELALALDVREPDRVGRDRLCAARGALDLVRRDALVVDAGTALTVDALRVRGGVATFLGGAIAPGPALLARALSDHTARLPQVEPRAGAPALGRDTESAVRGGVVVGFRGAARELTARIAAEAGLDSPAVVLTGGAAGLLLEPPMWAGAVHEPDLVHRGLLAALREALGR